MTSRPTNLANNMTEGILYKDLSYQLNGILFAVQNTLGTKFQEKHYLKTICIYLDEPHIPYKTEVAFPVTINGNLIGNFRADLIIDNKILIELKATDRLTKDHKLQMLRYLEALNLKLGLLANFRIRPLQIWRVPV